MTRLESLAKDCIENHTHKLVDKPTKQDIYLREESIYIAGYKECERRMKCCGNCSHFKLDNSGLYPINVCELTYPNRCKNHDKWEINENG